MESQNDIFLKEGKFLLAWGWEGGGGGKKKQEKKIKCIFRVEGF